MAKTVTRLFWAGNLVMAVVSIVLGDVDWATLHVAVALVIRDAEGML